MFCRFLIYFSCKKILHIYFFNLIDNDLIENYETKYSIRTYSCLRYLCINLMHFEQKIIDFSQFYYNTP